MAGEGFTLSEWPVCAADSDGGGGPGEAGGCQRRQLAVIRRDSRPQEALLSAWQLADVLVARGRYGGVKAAREAISSLALAAGKVVRSTTKEIRCLKRRGICQISTSCLVSSGDAIKAMQQIGGAAAALASDLNALERGLSRLQVGLGRGCPV